jgi:signal transduction histidine kinase
MRPSRFLDPALGLIFLVAGLVEVWAPLDTSLGTGSQPLATLTCVLAAAGVALRRRMTGVAALLVCVPAPLVYAITPIPLLFFGGLLPLLVMTYTLAARRPLTWLVLPALSMAALQIQIPQFHRPGEIVFDWICLPAAAAVGWVVGAREARVAETEARTASLERTAVAEERVRIARELHDVVAHALSVVVVQAGAAIDDEPERAREALRSIRATGVEALGEMRRMLGILREQGDELALAPQPSVAELDPLLEHARAAGLDARLVVEGAPRALPPGLDLAAYRIVQEALTNVRKHAAQASRVDVRLRYGPAAVELEVVDDGHANGNGSPGDGHGLIGMRERVGLYGGELTVGPALPYGYRVHASLPIT